MKNLVLAVFILSVISCKISSPKSYVYNEGFTQGTTYHVAYQIENGRNLQLDIRKLFQKMDHSLSSYIDSSVISEINENHANIEVDSIFIDFFNQSTEVSKKTGGAFDITVAPLVNAWGFGAKKGMKNLSAKTVDSLKQMVGFEKVTLKGKKLIKTDPRIKLDANAIAQGMTVDLVADFFESLNISNYLVEIGGEVRVKGVNEENLIWKIGINKPIDDATSTISELQDIVILKNKSLSTSGNYRRFYMKDGKKYAHTIDPKSGYPVQHELLSASVMTDKCSKADAFATAFMVLGLEKSKILLKQNPDLSVYFIYTDSQGKLAVWMSQELRANIYQNTPK